MEFVSEKNSNKVFEKKGVAGKIFAEHAKNNGLIVRAIGDVIAFCPPLIITDPQINDMFDIVEHSLKLTMDDLTKKGLIV
jgi:4-aminobutyrate--pyruvate transaminase